MRDPQLTSAKATLRGWFAAQPVEYLMRVVDECRSGDFSYSEPCHCVRGLMEGGYVANNSVEACRAENALAVISELPWVHGRKVLNHEEAEDRLARVRTLPIVLAEIKKRHRVPTAPPVEVACE